MEGESYPYLKWEGEKGKRKADKGEIYGGAGTEENPYQIRTPGGFLCIPYEQTGSYRMTDDIDLLGEEFTPVGTSESPFKGSFDGDGHAVRGLKVAADGCAGLFGSAVNATFKNLRIEGAEIESTGSSVGILAGSAERGRIESCVVTGSVRGAEHTGGLAGYAYGGRVSRCRAEGSVKGAEYVGGLIGRLCEGAVLEDSYAAGKVEMEAGSTYAGGLVGKSESSYTPKTSIERCYASASIEGKGKGLVGGANSNTIINNCYYDVQMSGITGGWGTGKLTDRKSVV